MTVAHNHRLATAGIHGCFLLLVQRSHVVLLLMLTFTVLLLCNGKACGLYLRVRQSEDTFDGAVEVTYLVHKGRYHLTGLEDVTRQHPVLDKRAVLAHALMELLRRLVNHRLQLLVLALGGLAPPGVLLGAVVAHDLHVTAAVAVNGTVRRSPESGHAADAAELVERIHHYHTVGTAGEVHAR